MRSEDLTCRGQLGPGRPGLVDEVFVVHYASEIIGWIDG